MPEAKIVSRIKVGLPLKLVLGMSGEMNLKIGAFELNESVIDLESTL